MHARIDQSAYFGLLVDEVTDITVTSQFLLFIQYFDFNSLKVRCDFLEIQDILSEG